MEKQISEMLMGMGIMPNLLGFDYLKDAIMLVAEEDKNYLHESTKRLYMDIAKKHGSSSSRVIRCIRHAITKTDTGLRSTQFIGKYAELVRLEQ